jgi:outer membrane lipoprotein
MDTSSTQTPKPALPAPSRKVAKLLMWRLVTWLGLALLAACSASPISKPLRTAAEHQPPFGALAARPDAFKGQTVLLGGSVVQTTNLPKTTEIEVLEKPLNRYDSSPEGGDRSSGRFLVRCPGFLDSAIYAKDREITVAGPVEGQETRPLDQVQYTYPVIGCQELHLWPNLPPAAYYYPPPYGGFGPYWGGWYGYYPYYWYPYW